MPDQPDPGIWAKFSKLPWPYPLACHMLDTSAITGALWDQHLGEGQRQQIAAGFGTPLDETRHMIMFWAGLHDIGKCCPHFAGQPSGPKPKLLNEPDFAAPAGWMHEEPIRHERVSHLVVPALLTRYGYPAGLRPSRSVAHQVGQILGGHHGRYGLALDRATMADPGKAEPRVGTAPGWTGQRDALADTLFDACGRPSPPAHMAPTGTAVIVTGLIVLADWLASQTDWLLAQGEQWYTTTDDNHAAHYARATKTAAGHVQATQLNTASWKPAPTFHHAFPHITAPHPLQTDLAARLPDLAKGPGLLLVTAPTGDGKTESALYGARIMGHASGRTGLALLLPTMATTDAMWLRTRDYTAASTLTDTPVTLVHSMAWLNTDYDNTTDILTDNCTSTFAGDWIRGRHRPLLSPVTVGTWDQGTIAILPTRYSAMRWLAMSGKTIIIDEAHAYDAFGHALTARLLEWLGHLGAPVILLSATLARSIAQRLVDAYRTGAGHTTPSTTTPAYPGWVYTDALTGKTTASDTIPTTRARTLTIDLIDARHTHDLTDTTGRASALDRLLAPLYDATADSGAALLVCNTVPDAQSTYRQLTARTGTRSPRILLLHARMPVWQRDEITRNLLTVLGPKTTRPTTPVILISTQLAEQSLDIDADLVISDLAPLAQLLQRAGRGHRHELGTRGTRPAWAPTPRLAILNHTGQLPPRAWGNVYDPALLRRTQDLLTTRNSAPIHVPADIATIIETVYADLNELADQALADDEHRAAREAADTATGNARTIPTPAAVTDLYPLTTYDGDEDDLVTRLGADSLRLLPTYTTPNGQPYLDAACTRPLPTPPPGHDRLDRHTVAALVRLTVACPSTYLPADDPHTKPPANWSHTPIARDLRLLPHPTTAGTPQPYTASSHTLYLHPELGIVRTPVTPRR
ncbi:CRISPR-associated helicase Cas3' [Streptomyces californicus]|uniref:CRISPR-associated helicase Cas3' n=1 Tax=Streptomyces californicus TaxID=67351 RepID=UPI0037FCC479